MHVRTWLALLVLLGGSSGFRISGSGQEISRRLRAAAISEAVLARRSEIREEFKVNACSVYAALDRHADYAKLLDRRVVMMLSGETSNECATPRAYVSGSGPWWEVQAITEGSGTEMILRARFVAPFTGERDEEYVVERGDQGSGVRVTMIRLLRTIDKITQPLVPGRTAPRN